jgi:hypothetical protein
LPREPTTLELAMTHTTPTAGAPATHDPDDLVWGGAAIAETINRTVPATFYMLENKQLPAKKVGGRWVGSRRKLIAHLAGEATA